MLNVGGPNGAMTEAQTLRSCRSAGNTKHDRYNRSPKGQARTARYEGSAKGLLRKIRYDATRRKGVM